jgi:hypothetical protein
MSWRRGGISGFLQRGIDRLTYAARRQLPSALPSRRRYERCSRRWRRFGTTGKAVRDPALREDLNDLAASHREALLTSPRRVAVVVQTTPV